MIIPRQEVFAANLRVNQAIFWTSDKDKAIDLKKVGELRGVEFSHTDSVALLPSPS